ncbi:MAG: hypothetical protein ACI8Z5_000031 [Lentimonas sp.]|jgi:hypothetical protein
MVAPRGKAPVVVARRCRPADLSLLVAAGASGTARTSETTSQYDADAHRDDAALPTSVHTNYPVRGILSRVATKTGI